MIEAVPELVKAITEAGISIWNAFREARKESRDAILNELEHLEWRSFAGAGEAVTALRCERGERR